MYRARDPERLQKSTDPLYTSSLRDTPLIKSHAPNCKLYVADARTDDLTYEDLFTQSGIRNKLIIIINIAEC